MSRTPAGPRRRERGAPCARSCSMPATSRCPSSRSSGPWCSCSRERPPCWPTPARRSAAPGRLHRHGVALSTPSVILLVRYVRAPRRRAVAVSRRGVLRRDGHRCAYCRNHAATVDHVLPRSRGGGDTWENLVACCLRCNGLKGNRTPRRARLAPAGASVRAGRAGLGAARRRVGGPAVGGVPRPRRLTAWRSGDRRYVCGGTSGSGPRVGTGMSEALQVEIWSDVVCPWCYIGKRRFEAGGGGLRRPGEVTWRSFQLDPTRARRGHRGRRDATSAASTAAAARTGWR